MIYGVDISNWQQGVNYGALKRNGISFAIIKSSEGTGYRDPLFRTHLDGCVAAGMVVAAYHYVRGSDADGQFRLIQSIVPKHVPVILDVEDGAGTMESIRRLIDLLLINGYKSPLIYFPQWYWNKIGRPSLHGLPPNWWSWYPDNNGQGRTLEEGINMVPQWVWGGFGGLPVQIIQFTSTGRVEGYGGNLDLNAYRGTVEDLKALFGSSNAGGGGGSMEGDDFLMGLPQWQQERIFDRILRMSMGKAGENFHGEQFEWQAHQFADLSNKSNVLLAKLDGLIAAVAALSNDADLTKEEVTAIINEAVKQNLKITGTIEITGNNEEQQA